LDDRARNRCKCRQYSGYGHLIYSTIQCLKGQYIQAFRFLSTSAIVIASVSRSESTAVLELFRLPVTNGRGRPTPMIKVVALGLPFVDDGYCIYRVDFYPHGVKNLVISQGKLLYNASIDTKPFVNPKFHNIIFVYLGLEGPPGYGHDRMSFVVHHSTLLRYIPPSHSHDNVQASIPWELWGPTATRWHEGGVLASGQVSCGLRCLLHQRRARRWELWDFNPYRVRRLGKDFVVESESAWLTVETEPSCAKSEGIKNGVYSSLPFVKLVPKKWPKYIFAGLYEDRIVGQLVSDYFDPPPLSLNVRATGQGMPWPPPSRGPIFRLVVCIDLCRTFLSYKSTCTEHQ
jgi:hypothetical protein